MNGEQDWTIGSGNVFEDLGFEEPENELAKAELVRQIAATISYQGRTYAATAEILGVEQAKLGALLRGRFGEYSPEQLKRFLARLNENVDVTVTPTAPTPGRRAIRVRPTVRPMAASGRRGNERKLTS